MIKAVFLDFDGTLFSHHSASIPASAYEAIDKLRENGIKVFLCTGRAFAEFYDFDLIGLTFSGKILVNGQIIYDKNDRIIYHTPIEGELKERLVDLFTNRRIPIYFAAEDKNFMNYVDDNTVCVQKAVGSDPPNIESYQGQDIYMATAFVDNEEQLRTITSLKEIAEVTYWHIGACDIVPKGISKLVGIREALKYWNIDMSETLAIGDGDNDVEMLKECAIGIAMGNSFDGVKEYADYVTDDIDEDGLYHALKHFELI